MIELKNVGVVIGSKKVFDDISFVVNAGEQIAIVGPSGSGKTSLLRLLSGQLGHRGSLLVSDNLSIAFVEQQHRFKNLSNTSSFYYQQRFNASDAEDAVTVEDYINEQCAQYGKTVQDEEVKQLLKKLHIPELFDRRLIQLSNGENKRLQIAKSLLSGPKVLLLDNPYLGLDVEARAVLTNILEGLTFEGIEVVMTISQRTLPSFITHVLMLDGDGNVVKKTTEEFSSHKGSQQKQELAIDKELLQRLTAEDEAEDFDTIISMNNVHVAYGGKDILKDINWAVKRGDKWALSGANGAGKSTLLSLINADNPQAYANEIYLFEKRRGRGESIWDIKRKIGYVSPELHLFFESSSTIFSVVASGLFDTIGLFRVLNEEQAQKANDWMQLLQIENYANQLLINLPLGMQRLALLARALIKNPPLLLLDEPAQGLDDQQAALFKNIIEQICEHSNQTLIYVSHYKEEVPSSVRKFIHLENGKIAYINK